MRLLKAMILITGLGVVLTSCGSNKTCPAYGESQKYIKETRY